MISQRHWRTVGLLAIMGAALLAWNGAEQFNAPQSTLYLLGYWGLFLLLLVVAVYTAVLDLRYIRMQYALGQRELFQQTIEDEAFRAALASHQSQSTPEEDQQRPS